jgi:hypothetical protein
LDSIFQLHHAISSGLNPRTPKGWNRYRKFKILVNPERVT